MAEKNNKDHTCFHEEEFGRYEEAFKNNHTEHETIIKSLDEVLKCIKGESGLSTRLALSEQKMDNLIKISPSLKKIIVIASVWGGMSGGIVIIGSFLIK